MKKTTGSKRLLLSSEKIRDLQPRHLVRVAGGLCMGTYLGDTTNGAGGGVGICVNSGGCGGTIQDCKLTGASCALTGTL